MLRSGFKHDVLAGGITRRVTQSLFCRQQTNLNFQIVKQHNVAVHGCDPGPCQAPGVRCLIKVSRVLLCTRVVSGILAIRRIVHIAAGQELFLPEKARSGPISLTHSRVRLHVDDDDLLQSMAVAVSSSDQKFHAARARPATRRNASPVWIRFQLMRPSRPYDRTRGRLLFSE